MSTNREVADAFWNKQSAASRNMTSTGYRLFSYGTVIAEWYEGKVIGNFTRYSAATTKHQPLARYFNCWLVLGGVPRGCKSLVHFITEKGMTLPEGG